MIAAAILAFDLCVLIIVMSALRRDAETRGERVS